MNFATLTFVTAQLPLLASVLGGTTPDGGAPKSELPTGAAIVDRFIEVTGGKAAYDKIHNRVRHDRIVHVGMGFEDKVVNYTARPNKRYVNITSEVMGDIQSGSDGNIVWRLQPGIDPLVETGEARLARLSELAFDRLNNWRDYYEKAELVQETSIDGQPCYEVLMTPKVGPAETHYYDKKTGLLIKTQRTLLSSFLPTIVFDISIGDYREVDGILLPHKVDQKFDQCGSPREMMFVTEHIEQNVDLPSDRFTPPASVMAAATAESIGGLVKDLVGAKEETPPAPCGSKSAKTEGSGEENKEQAQSKKPCVGGS